MNNESESLRALVFASAISADNREYSEEVKQEVLRRHELMSAAHKSIIDPDINWDYVFEPLGEDACKYAKIMKEG
jgi:hypothetical protein